MRTINRAKLTLVGAGPGDPELLSIKGMKTLFDADVVIYDALVHPDLLLYAPQAELIFAGKRRSHHHLRQDEINQLIVQKALEKGHVVRLKGGDPFLFGRGGEEIAFAQQHGIDTGFVPGITSATSVPATAGISLTQRGISDSVWVVTGTTSKGHFSADLLLAAKSKATVVILMGMQNLEKIVEAFQNERKSDTPVAIIQNGYLPEQKEIIGRLSTISALVDQHQLANPAIIVIGDVVEKSGQHQSIFSQVESFYQAHVS